MEMDVEYVDNTLILDNRKKRRLDDSLALPCHEPSRQRTSFRPDPLLKALVKYNPLKSVALLNKDFSRKCETWVALTSSCVELEFIYNFNEDEAAHRHQVVQKRAREQCAHLRLKKAGMFLKEIETITKLIEKNPNLRTLRVYFGDLFELELTSDELFKAIGTAPRLESVTLVNLKLQDPGYRSLKFQELFEPLHVNKRLNKIDVSGSNIGDEDIAAIDEMLCGGNLKELGLAGTKLTRKAGEHIACKLHDLATICWEVENFDDKVLSIDYMLVGRSLQEKLDEDPLSRCFRFSGLKSLADRLRRIVPKEEIKVRYEPVAINRIRFMHKQIELVYKRFRIMLPYDAASMMFNSRFLMYKIGPYKLV